ncbi:hypothetical protein BGX28_003115 [Mortierella sp. GBA30]|nr:hypothetical protein BGX28_003115 [Mortierella sp. GBA30]
MRIANHILFLAFCANLYAVQGQPQPCGGSAFARVGSNFYIQGGATYADNLLQSMWALDLTTSWTTAQPAWKALPAGPFNAYHSAAHNANNQTFLTFGRDTAAPSSQIPANWLNSFDIQTGTWSSWNPIGLKDNTRRDFYAVTNPAANKVYILGGDASATGGVVANQFDTYDPTTRALVEIDTPTSGPQNSVTYAAVWVPRQSVMLVIGGTISGVSPQSLWVYHPDTAEWSTQQTLGTSPYGRISHCAASNADGSIVAVFGGYTTGSSVGDPNAYILDTTTWTWTLVPYSGRGRGNAACAIVDDTFLIWGGFYDNPSKAGGVPSGAEALLLLSISKKSWGTSYTPSAAITSSGTGSGSSNGGVGSGGLSNGAIGGIAGGAAAVLLIIIALVIMRRRKSKPKAGKTDITEAEAGAGGNASVFHPPKTEPSPGVPPASYTAAMDPSTQASPAPEYAYYYQQGQYPSPHQQPGYDYPEQYHQQQFYQPTQNFTESQYVDGHNAATASAIAPTIYYPPPPSSSQQGTPGQDTIAAYSDAATPTGSIKVPMKNTADSNTADQYHDSFGMKHASMMSDGSVSTAVASVAGGKRPVSGPQGGLGFGSLSDSMSAPGAPQAILPK